MGVEDRFQVTLVESQVQNDFIFSSSVFMRNSVCLCFPCSDSCLPLPHQHLAVNGTRQRSNKSLRSSCTWLQGNASSTWLSFFCPCNLLPGIVDRIAASQFFLTVCWLLEGPLLLQSRYPGWALSPSVLSAGKLQQNLAILITCCSLNVFLC